MTLFALYRSPDATALPAAVAERFSWFAALLPPVHALVHRLWDQLGLFVISAGLVVLAGRFLGSETAFWLYLLFAVAFGVAAPGARRRALERREFKEAGHRFAGDADLARLAVLEPRS
ncbi:DUF2628 domain-containing protein [Devosia sp. Leaf64]|uniref:DUF2628 domain-containing protein n=1 Tax=Devosia sp. Leaf64 TaxID=1736229 RepID=UPI0007138BB5|nr:DUF2628 domain-containing protein [Devosia sp. Leaf64]KQN73667.1 hypothetical protein ASE94_05240 [Devosia sp. Leaf64]